VDFEFDEDQLGLQAAAAEVLVKECPPSLVRSVTEGDDDARSLWKTLCSLDWPGLAIAEDHGGVGSTGVELAIVLEQLGYAADPTPFLATTTQFVPLVRTCGDGAQRERFLGAIARDGASATMALAGPDGRWDPAAPAVEARRSGSGWRLSGRAAFVLDGDRVDEVAVVARTEAGPEVLVVPGADLAARRQPALDGTAHITSLDLDGVEVGDDRRLAGGDVATGVRASLEEAVTGLALTMVGACQRAIDMVVDYVGGREQFGVPVGSFQAVKHKAVDMHIAVERARAVGYFAALAIAEDDPRRSAAASMAKAAAGDAQRLVFQLAIQLFGGIGFTWENDVHLFLRRAKLGELLLGGAAEHRAKVASWLLDGRPV
jgi:alkylation response protein AidB-like acyl-CoA dehydrogenase